MKAYQKQRREGEEKVNFTIFEGLTVWCWSSKTFSVSVSVFEWESVAFSIGFDANGFSNVRTIVLRTWGSTELNKLQDFLVDSCIIVYLEQTIASLSESSLYIRSSSYPLFNTNEQAKIL